MLKNISEPNTAPDPEPESSTADDIVKAIKLAKGEFKSCDVLVNLRQAQRFLKNLGYTWKPYREGILVSFEKANIYIHEPGKKVTK
jgi:hypothetical protein